MAVQAIEMRCLKDWIAVYREFWIALVVGLDDEHIGASPGARVGEGESGKG